MYYNYKRVCIDVSKMKTCGVCHERPIFFSSDDLQSHHQKVHQSRDDNLTELRHQVKQISDLLITKENKALCYQQKKLVACLQKEEETIEDAMRLVKEEVGTLKTDYESKVNVIRKLETETDELSYRIEYKSKELKFLFQQRRKIDEEYLRRKHTDDKNTALNAWRAECEREALQALQTIHKGTASYERGERIADGKSDLMAAMDNVVSKINVLEDEVLSMKDQKKCHAFEISMEEKDGIDIQQELHKALTILEAKDKELKSCRIQITSLQNENKVKESAIQNLQKNIKRNQNEINDLRNQLAQKDIEIATLQTTHIANRKVTFGNLEETRSDDEAKVFDLQLTPLSSEDEHHVPAAELIDGNKMIAPEVYFNMKSRKDDEINELIALYNEKNEKYQWLKKKYKNIKGSPDEVKGEANAGDRDTDAEQNTDGGQSTDAEQNTDVKQLNIQIEKLLKENTLLVKTSQWEKQLLSNRLENKNMELRQYEEQLYTLQKQLETSSDDKKAERCDDQLESIKSEQCDDQLESIKVELKEHKAELSKLKNDYQHVIKEKTSLKRANVNLTEKKKEFESTMKKERAALQTSKEEYSILQIDNAEMRLEIENLREEVDKICQSEKLITIQNEDSKQSVDDLKSKNECLNSENLQLQNKCNEYEKYVGCLKEKQKKTDSNYLKKQGNLEEEVKRIREELESREYTRLMTELEDMRNQLSLKAAQIEEQTKVISDLGKQVLQLQEEQDNTDVENTRLIENAEMSESELRKYTAKVEELKRKIDSEVKLSAKLEESCEVKGKEIMEMKTRYELLVVEITSLKDEKSVIQEENGNLQVQLSTDRTKHNKETTTLKHEYEEKITNLKNVVQQLEEEVLNLKNIKNEPNDDKKQVEILTAKLKEKKKIIKENETSINEARNDAKKSWEELLHTKQNLEDTELNLSMCNNELNTLSEKYKTLKERCRNREERLKTVRSEAKDMKQTYDDTVQEQENKIIGLKKSIKEYEATFAKLGKNENQKAKSTRKQITELNKEITDLKQQVETRTQECKTYENDLKRMKERRKNTRNTSKTSTVIEKISKDTSKITSAGSNKTSTVFSSSKENISVCSNDISLRKSDDAKEEKYLKKKKRNSKAKRQKENYKPNIQKLSNMSDDNWDSTDSETSENKVKKPTVALQQEKKDIANVKSLISSSETVADSDWDCSDNSIIDDKHKNNRKVESVHGNSVNFSNHKHSNNKTASKPGENNGHSDWDSSDESISIDNKAKNQFRLKNTTKVPSSPKHLVVTSSTNGNLTTVPIAKALSEWMSAKAATTHKTSKTNKLPTDKFDIDLDEDFPQPIKKSVKRTKQTNDLDDIDALLADLEGFG